MKNKKIQALSRSIGAYYRTKLGLNLVKDANVIDLDVKPKAKKKTKSTKKSK
jgi:hypothetical protein